MAEKKPRWMPDWKALMAEAEQVRLEETDGHVYLVADSHLGDRQADPAAFVAMLEKLPKARMVVLMGDLFQVWLAYPKFWDTPTRNVLQALQAVRDKGVQVVMIQGNREFFLPASIKEAHRRGLPFDRVVPGAMVLDWAGRKLGLAHGDLANRHDTSYLKWRRFSRSTAFEWAFRLMPGHLARRLSRELERILSGTNTELKISYPAEELAAFAAAVLPGLDGFFIGHFHREETLKADGQQAVLRIVPDWMGTRTVFRLDSGGGVEPLKF